MEKKHHGKFKSKIVILDRKPRTIYFFEGREPRISAMGQVGMMKVAARAHHWDDWMATSDQRFSAPKINERFEFDKVYSKWLR